jgi:hypothetical protein
LEKIRGKILEKTRGNFGTTPISRSKTKMYAKLKGDFYFRALGSLVVLSFPQLLSFSSVLSKPLSKTLTSARTAGCPMGQQL